MSDLEATAGETLLVDLGPVTRVNDAGATVPVDLTLGGTKLWFTAKRSKSDADAAAVIAKTYVQGGPAGGIAVDVPSSAEKNRARATVPASDTVGITRSTHLEFEWQLEEPSGRISYPDRGTISLLAAVTIA